MTNVLSQSARPATAAGSRTEAPQAAVIVNPSKFSARHLRHFMSEVARSFEALDWLAPVWLETTASTRGAQEARTAMSAGVDVVFVAGGDGTVRTVAQELAGHDIPLALLPMGTGNLFARNLGIPRHDLDAAVRIACTGTDRRIDVGWLELDEAGDGIRTERFAFLVMAGGGFDAATMEGANHTMKTRLGPTAYLISGARAVQRRMASTTVTVDGAADAAHTTRGVIVGNCGQLTMGLTLMPDADPADGILDAVVLRQRTVLDWARVLVSVATRRPAAAILMPRLRGRIIEVRIDTPQPVEVDGDVVGDARAVRFEVQHAALLVRTAASEALDGSVELRDEVGEIV